MALLLVLLLALGVAFAIRGLRLMLWGMRFLKGHRIPENFKAPGSLDNDPQRLGLTLFLYGMVVMFFGTFGFISAGAALLRGPKDELSVMGEKLRLFSNSTNPWLDIAKLFIVNWIAACIYLGVRWLRGQQKEAGTSPGEKQAPAKGRRLIAAGTLVCLVTVAVCVYLTAQVGYGDGADGPLLIITPPVILFVSPAVYAAGLNLRRKGRRHLIPTIAVPEDLPPDSYVLYLRSFSDDDAFEKPQRLYGSAVLHHFLISGRSEEERLAAAVKRLGPLVAVGKPGETLPYAGARRLYLPHDEKLWKPVVSAMMADARLVVLSLGPGHHTMWELVEAARILPPERLVLLVPMDKTEYEEFRTKAHGRLRVLPDPPALPPYTPDPRMRQPNTHSRMQALIHYSRASDGRVWKPYFVWLDSELIPLLRFSEFRDKLYVALKHGLRPVVDHLITGRTKGPQQLPSFNVGGRIALGLAVMAIVVAVSSRCGGTGG
jgi:hypothetical protein